MNYEQKKSHYLEWAENTGPVTHEVFRYYLELPNAQITGVSFCEALVALGERYGPERIEIACRELRNNGGIPSLRLVRRYVAGAEVDAQLFCPEDEKKIYLASGITRGMKVFQQKPESSSGNTPAFNEEDTYE